MSMAQEEVVSVYTASEQMGRREPTVRALPVVVVVQAVPQLATTIFCRPVVHTVKAAIMVVAAPAKALMETVLEKVVLVLYVLFGPALQDPSHLQTQVICNETVY
jgi:hypothetical protein